MLLVEILSLLIGIIVSCLEVLGLHLLPIITLVWLGTDGRTQGLAVFVLLKSTHIGLVFVGHLVC